MKPQDEGEALEYKYVSTRLPQYSDKGKNLMKLRDYKGEPSDLIDWIPSWSELRTYEMDHSFIDFRMVILGEKMRNPESEVIFNDLYLSKLITSVPHDEFYGEDSIHRIIDFQFA